MHLANGITELVFFQTNNKNGIQIENGCLWSEVARKLHYCAYNLKSWWNFCWLFYIYLHQQLRSKIRILSIKSVEYILSISSMIVERKLFAQFRKWMHINFALTHTFFIYSFNNKANRMLDVFMYENAIRIHSPRIK